jgi:hypothetical protein
MSKLSKVSKVSKVSKAYTHVLCTRLPCFWPQKIVYPHRFSGHYVWLAAHTLWSDQFHPGWELTIQFISFTFDHPVLGHVNNTTKIVAYLSCFAGRKTHFAQTNADQRSFLFPQNDCTLLSSVLVVNIYPCSQNCWYWQFIRLGLHSHSIRLDAYKGWLPVLPGLQPKQHWPPPCRMQDKWMLSKEPCIS